MITVACKQKLYTSLTIGLILLVQINALAVAFQRSGRVTDPLGNPLPGALAEALPQSITSDKGLNFILVPAETVTLSGKLLDKDGNGIPGQYVGAFPTAGGIGAASTRTDTQGNYSLAVAPGDYRFNIQGYYWDDPVSMNVPRRYNVFTTAPFSISQDTILDFQFPPVHTVTIHVQDPDGGPVANTLVESNSSDNSSLSLARLPASGWSQAKNLYTNANGDTVTWLFPTNSANAYTFNAYPPTESKLVATTPPGERITADKTVTITLGAAVTLSGKLLDKDGNGIPGQYVRASPLAGGTGAASIRTDAQGNYSLSVAPGDYRINIQGYYWDDPASMNVPRYYNLYTTAPFSISQDTILDLQFPPVHTVTIHVQDPAGNPIANTLVESNRLDNSSLSLAGLPASGWSRAKNLYTNANGDITTWLFPTNGADTYTFNAYPPTGSKLVAAVPPGERITADKTVTITLGATVMLSGKLLDKDGNGIPGQYVRASPSAGGTGAASIRTDAQGNYSLAVAPGDYRIDLQGYYWNDPASMNVPRYYDVYTTSPFSISQDTILDLQFPPVHMVTIHVQDPAGSPIANALIESNSLDNSSLSLAGLPASGWSQARNLYTNANGDITTWLFPTRGTNTYTFNTYPPTGAPFTNFSIRDITVTSDKFITNLLQFIHAPPATTTTFTPDPNSEGNYPSDVTVSLSATAIAGFNVANTYYRVDNGPQQTYSRPFVLSGDGVHTLRYWSIDGAGVYETPKRRSFAIQYLRITTSSPLPDGKLGETYTTTLTAAGGVSPYAWSLVSGSLPPGFQLDQATGEITGTPASEGVFNFTVQATDSSSVVQTAQKALLFRILPD
jgi:protocatechuate 3,4-dioxygenase beta subunit